jgi:hypothetical protein
MRAVYRLRQFWAALFASPAEADLDLARRTLSNEQMALFGQMQASEQAHSLDVFKKLSALSPPGFPPEGSPEAQGRALLVAALLHDAGKSRFPLRPWERALIVMARAAAPGKVQQWGRAGEPQGWRRPFVIAEQHPAWGAELAAAAGTCRLAVNLIREHQNPLAGPAVSLEERLLQILQSIDNDS